MALQDESYMAPRFEFLHREAAFSLIKMVAAAQTQGIQIAVVSGYRDFATQASLFQNRVGDLGSEAEAAKSVAPPGYSEHHTGYAVDLTDGAHDFRDFDQTPAFQWMVAHAHEYGFELSFPPNNLQGVDYEPWHWRFVGSPEAAGLFEAVREGQL
ncbi:MAG: M15 family metallopeptidase [Cyanobacteria bacterium CRU_2_1]|nr:M15 family metallopeptidase [Cyanobacteria bacterium RU_5_0]NJR62746.1 M15 family metallopeptidase [Cyanobacteria bacterium CRU_2_1]